MVFIFSHCKQKMSAFRGARFLASLGQHGIKCHRLHQRRIVSLGLTSLYQVTMKKQALLDTNALPVNKFDLSGVGILSPTLSTLFSTEALALAEDGSDLTDDEDSEVGMISKCHSSIRETIAQIVTAYLTNTNNNDDIRRKYIFTPVPTNDIDKVICNLHSFLNNIHVHFKCLWDQKTFDIILKNFMTKYYLCSVVPSLYFYLSLEFTLLSFISTVYYVYYKPYIIKYFVV